MPASIWKKCSCRAASLSCTDLCNWDSDQCENDNDYHTASQQESDDENDDKFIKVMESDPFWSENKVIREGTPS